MKLFIGVIVATMMTLVVALVIDPEFGKTFGNFIIELLQAWTLQRD